jgi:hypothetical protein
LQWVIDEADQWEEKHQQHRKSFTADEIADLVVQARDAWDGGAR